MEVRHPASGMHYYQSLHQLLPNPHLPTNGFNIPPFHSHINPSFISTFITHHQTTTTEPISTTLFPKINPMSNNIIFNECKLRMNFLLLFSVE
jgi:hypothetical protein